MKKKAAVFILPGQSDAVGHKLPMKPEDVIDQPMKNEFGLSQAENQSFALSARYSAPACDRRQSGSQ